MKFAEMDKQLQDWKAEKAHLLQQRVDVMKKASDLRAERDKYLSDRIPGASTETLWFSAEFAGQVRYHDSPDSYKGCGPGGPLRIVPSGHARTGDADGCSHGRRTGIRQPSQ